MTARSWVPEIILTEHGHWDPQDHRACAELIAEVNRLRRPDNPRPKIRRDDWGEKRTWLDATIDNTSMRIDPGEHLISARMPRGDLLYVSIVADELEMFEPPT